VSFVQELRGLGLRDEGVSYIDGSTGNVVQEFVSGLNAGGKIVVELAEDGPGATLVTATAYVPMNGPKKLLAPVIRPVFQRIGDTALEEDRADLEEWGYEPRSA
jgi:hypothetical protein